MKPLEYFRVYALTEVSFAGLTRAVIGEPRIDNTVCGVWDETIKLQNCNLDRGFFNRFQHVTQ